MSIRLFAGMRDQPWACVLPAWKRRQERRAKPQRQRRTKRLRSVPKPRFQRFTVGFKGGVRVNGHLAANRHHMHELMIDLNPSGVDRDSMGACSGWMSRTRPRRNQIVLGGVLTRLVLNRRDCATIPADLIAHESTHIAYTLARVRGIDPVEGEEWVAGVVGEVSQLVANRLNALGAFR